MLTYNPEEKIFDNARNNLYREFVQGRKEILASSLSDEEKQEAISSLLQRINESIELLGKFRIVDQVPEEDREDLGISAIPEVVVDENIVNTLVELYAKKAREKEERSPLFIENEEEIPEEDIDTTALEEELRVYFTEHYSDLFNIGYNNFLSDFAEQKDERDLSKDGELVEIAKRCGIDPKKFKCFGYTYTIQDGLVAEEDSSFARTKVYYATPKGINDRITQIYNSVVYSEANDNTHLMLDSSRKLKNTYLKYAEEHDITIEDKDVYEEMQIDSVKVQDLAKYINKVLTARDGAEQIDNTEIFAEDITRNYSKIMNLQWYDFGDLESVKAILGECSYIEKLHLKIEEDNITRPDEFEPDIAYGTPGYIKAKYARVMARVKELHSSNAFTNGKFNVEKINKEKQALRKYIQENGIEGIDISIPQVEIDHDMTNKIADTLMGRYAESLTSDENRQAMRARILSKLEDSWSEIKTEYQCVDLKDLFKEELKEMGQLYTMDTLYVKDDFSALSDFQHFETKCIYATPEALKRNIAEFDEKISSRDLCFDEERGRKVLEQYAQENGIELNIPDVETLKAKHQQEKERMSFGMGFGRFNEEFMPDDPTARPKLDFNGTMIDTIMKMTDGLPGAIVGLTSLLKADKTGGMLLLGLDDMNIRGSQIWEAYKYLYNEDGEKFAKAVGKRDQKMVDFINQELASIGGEKAVTGGASFDRHKTPDKYRFTEEEVEELKQQRQERIAKEKEQRDKMLANSPAKKKRGAKKKTERDAKKQEYRQRLIAMGKKSLGELDKELTELQEKEQQAKGLCEQYEEQLPDKSHQEI